MAVGQIEKEKNQLLYFELKAYRKAGKLVGQFLYFCGLKGFQFHGITVAALHSLSVGGGLGCIWAV